MKQLADVRTEVDEFERIARLLTDATETLTVLGDEAGAGDEVDRLIAEAGAGVDALEIAANFDRRVRRPRRDRHDPRRRRRRRRRRLGADARAHVSALGRREGLLYAGRRGVAGRRSGAQVDHVFRARASNAYGMLESERGVHRLVRISPFDQQHRRHTSFASVDVIPEIESGEATDVEIKPEDLRIETFKSGGAGGQYVNKTESAIRITHVPSGIVVASQQERSQIQNRDVAMNILRAKLVQREIEERETKLAELRGERRANEWGSQIRSYVLQPYTMVKDHRTSVETGNVSAVLEGEIDGFIWPYLQQRRRPVAQTI